MKKYDLYGINTTSLNKAQMIVEETLSIRLNLHESSYRGGDYCRLNGTGKEHFIVQYNYNEHEDDWTEARHKDFIFLLYVNESNRADELRELLSCNPFIALLRREII
ncbi:MAG: hypothetical protein AAGI69_28575 [Cyanobacteria bacterium P01_H01_bin.21]